MELIRDRELGIVGERYDSFLEAYRVNDRRALNRACEGRGDGGVVNALFEADDGIVFAPDETRHALLYGSELFSGRYKEMRKRVQKTLRERYEWMDEDRFGADVRGEHIIMERYAIGHPEAFHRKRSTARRERSVAILYDAMCPASTPVAKRIEAGCIVAACADALERIGYRVELDFCLATYDGNSMSDDPTLLLEVALKGYGDALNVKRLEFPLAAKPVLFHLGVWWAHRFPGAPSDFGEGEGYPVSYDANRVRALEAYAKERHGAYLSEDIVEMQLHMDPTETLERVLGAVGEAGVLEEHMVGKTTMQASESPSQGKLFGGARRPGESDLREAPGEGDDTGADREGRCPGSADGGGPLRDGEGAVASAAPEPPGVPDGTGAAGHHADEDGAADGSGAAPQGRVPEGDESSESRMDSGGTCDDASDAAARAADSSPVARGADRTGRGTGEGDSSDISGGDSGQGEPVPRSGQPGTWDAVPSSGNSGPGSDGGWPGSDGATGPGKSSDDDGGAADSDDGSEEGPADAGPGAGGTAAGEGDGAQSASGSGAPATGFSGDGGEQGGGGGADERRGDQDVDDEEECEEDTMPDAGTQGESVNEDRGEDRDERDPQGGGESDDRDEELDSFIVALRKRYVRFERGDYRRAVERDLTATSQEQSGSGRGPVKAPPIGAVTGDDDYEFGTPRSTPFSMTYVPKRRN